MSSISTWSRRYRHWANLFAVIALLVGSLALPLAKPVAAGGEYTIWGTVIGANEAELANIQVHAYGDNGGESETVTVTGSDGIYSYSLLVPQDNYRVKFFGNGSDYVDGCLFIGASGNFTTNQYDCGVVAVTTSDVPLPTVTMPLGVRISGTVTGSDGATPENILVDADTGSPGPVTDTGGGGIFSLLVPTGSYKLYFHDDLNSTYVDGCYSSGASGEFTTDPNACTTLTLTMGSTVPWLNVTIPVGVRISGKVIDQNGQGLPNMWVWLSPDDFGWLSMATADNASAGTYSFAVMPGSYTVWFWDGGSDHVGGCYSSLADGNLDSRDNACSPVTVTSSPVTLPDVTMPLGVHISGTVTGPGGGPLNNITVAFANNGTRTAAGGTYSTNPLLPGSYTVDFIDDSNGNSTYVRGCYDLGASGNFTTNWNACTPVTVGTSDVPGIDVQMPLAADTPAVPGSAVTVELAAASPSASQPVSLTFSNVNAGGLTTLTTSTTAPAPLPAGYQLAGSATYYDLTTTATYSGPITVCISYAGVTPAPTIMLHYENGAWQGITTSDDTTNQIICGTTASLSPFVLATKMPIVDRYWTSAGVTLTVAAPGFLALTNVGTSSVVISQAPKGKLTLGSTPGSFTYVPPSGWSGTDSFSYKLNTGGVLSSPVTVTIFVLKSGMNCTGCNLSGLLPGAVSLTGANFSNANLTGTGLSHVNLAGSNLSGATLTGANLTSATVTGTNLSKATLSGASLSAANLTGSNLSGATLIGANLSSATLTGANLSNANLSSASLSGANLTGAHLSGANLTNALVDHANLTGANLAHAILTGADLTGATLTGVAWAGATCPDGTGANSHGNTCVGHLQP
ncbi:MAG: pentapeptide repeat-containing protein [Tepidisphaeraceae bacterium]